MASLLPYTHCSPSKAPSCTPVAAPPLQRQTYRCNKPHGAPTPSPTQDSPVAPACSHIAWPLLPPHPNTAQHVRHTCMLPYLKHTIQSSEESTRKWSLEIRTWAEAIPNRHLLQPKAPRRILYYCHLRVIAGVWLFPRTTNAAATRLTRYHIGRVRCHYRPQKQNIRLHNSSEGRQHAHSTHARTLPAWARHAHATARTRPRARRDPASYVAVTSLICIALRCRKSYREPQLPAHHIAHLAYVPGGSVTACPLTRAHASHPPAFKHSILAARAILPGLQASVTAYCTARQRPCHAPCLLTPRRPTMSNQPANQALARFQRPCVCACAPQASGWPPQQPPAAYDLNSTRMCSLPAHR